MVPRYFWLIAFTLIGACFSPRFKEGEIQCGANNSCPPGLECQSNLCYSSPPPVDAAVASGFALTVNVTGNGSGTVTSAPTGINCPTDCNETFMAGTSVTLTATPSGGATFVGWSGVCAGTGTCTVTVDAANSVTANFALQDTLMVSLAGNGTGLVTSSPLGISCGSDCMESFPPNTMVTLTAVASTGSTFDSWTGGGCGGNGPCTVTIDSAKMVAATFTLQQFTLTIDKAGTGDGIVTSAPAGINCGATCTRDYVYNTSVMLTAAAAYGSRFTGWSGDCSGTGTCMTSMTAERNVTATFTLVPPNRVFVTSTVQTGNLGGLAGADSICAARATAAGLTGTFRAWLSTSTVHAKDRLGTATGWVRFDGKPVFDNLTDLVAGKHSYPIQQDERGTPVGPGIPIATATSTAGNYDDDNGSWGSCSNWTSAASSTVYTGYADVNNFKWTQYAGGNCSNPGLRFYCFQTDNQAVARPPVVVARRAFTTNATWSPNGGGLASADALCNSEASAAGLAGPFRALLASTTSSAIGRFDATGRAWANVNNTLLAPTASALAATTPPFATFDAPPNLNAAGTIWHGDFQWTGAPDLVSIGTAADTCNNWTDNAATATGRMGIAGHASIAEAFNWGNRTWACNAARSLMCLQI